jgi:hypothetical protein
MRSRFVGLFIVAVVVMATMGLAMTPAFGQTAPQRRAPALKRTPDGKPDISGVWAGPAFAHKEGPGDTDAAAPTRYDPKLYKDMFKPGGEAIFYQKFTGDLSHDDPQSICMPVGFPRVALSPYSQQILQPPGYVVILYEYMHFWRVIPTDGRPHAKDVELTFMGDPVGHWEGDTLVVDTIGLREWPLAGDEPGRRDAVLYHSDALHVIERFTPTDANNMAYEITIDDPKIWQKPWTTKWSYKLHPTWQILEMVCEENNRCEAGKCKAAEGQK